VNEANPNCVKR